MQNLISLRWALGPYRWRFAGAIALGVVSMGIGLTLPLGVKNLLDVALSEGAHGTINTTALWVLLLFSFRALVGFASAVEVRILGEHIVRDLRRAAFAGLLGSSVRFHAKHSAGDLAARLTTDIGLLRTALTDSLVSIVLQTLRLLGSVAIMFTLNRPLGVIVLATWPLAAFASRHWGRRITTATTRLQQAVGATHGLVGQVLAAIRVVKLFGREEYEARRFDTAQRLLFAEARGVATEAASFSSAIELTFVIATVAVFWAGGHQVIAGALTPGELVAFVFYAQAVSSSLIDVAQQFATLSAGEGAAGRIATVLRPIDKEEWGLAVVRPGGNGLGVRLDNVSFSHAHDRVALGQVSFEVYPNELVVIAGKSGSGKSTLLELIARLHDPVEGVVAIGGQDVRTLARSSLRMNVSVVPQQPTLFGGSIRENIRYGNPGASDSQVVIAVTQAGAEEFVRALPAGLDTVIASDGSGLSGGQVQRLALARALVARPRLLLLDEPTSSVEPQLEERLLGELAAHAASGCTVVVVSHSQAAFRHADRVIFINNGTVAAAGDHNALIDSLTEYRELWRTTLGPGGQQGCLV